MAREDRGVYAYKTKQATPDNFRDVEDKQSCTRGFLCRHPAMIDKTGLRVQAAAGTLRTDAVLTARPSARHASAQGHSRFEQRTQDHFEPRRERLDAVGA